MGCGCNHQQSFRLSETVNCERDAKWLNGYMGHLSARLGAADSILPINNHLATLLIDGWADLKITDGARIEIVRAKSFGNLVQIQRGLFGSVAADFPAGSCVTFETTRDLVRAELREFLSKIGFIRENNQSEESKPQRVQLQLSPLAIDLNVRGAVGVNAGEVTANVNINQKNSSENNSEADKKIDISNTNTDSNSPTIQNSSHSNTKQSENNDEANVIIHSNSGENSTANKPVGESLGGGVHTSTSTSVNSNKPTQNVNKVNENKVIDNIDKIPLSSSSQG